MRKTIPLLLLAVLTSHTYAAPQLISFKEGKLGVNFAGYHAGVGLGGLLGGGAAGGLYAEAGTPHGQSARAGLGGVVSEDGGTAGGLYAGATAGGNVKASAGLAGGVNADAAAGAGIATAQAGSKYAASGMGGETSIGGSSEFAFSGSHDVVAPLQPVGVHKSIHANFNVDSINEVQPLPIAPVKTVQKTIIHETVKPVVVKEIYVQPETKIEQKEYIHTHHPHRHQFRKTTYLGAQLGGQGGVATVVDSVPQIQKKIDVGAESSLHAGAAIEGGVHAGGVGAGHVYTKQVSYQKSPTFFTDIFNIPISTLKAVGNFLGNTAANTNISVQKSVHAESDTKSLTSGPSSSSLSSSAHVSVETPPASNFFDDILAIPINTLGAVNKFLENNVAARKNVQIVEDGAAGPSRVRLGPHARRRANKRVVVIQEEAPHTSDA